MITLIIAVTFSAILNIFLFFYVRSLIIRLMIITDNIEEMRKILSHYRNHLKSVYEMETFYGDETLHNLLDHSKDLNTEIQDFINNFMIVDEAEDEKAINEDNEDEDDDEEEE